MVVSELHLTDSVSALPFHEIQHWRMDGNLNLDPPTADNEKLENVIESAGYQFELERI